jgi:hypothetical protein
MKYKVFIEGITPYMQDRMDDIGLEKWEKQRHHIIERKGINEEDAKKAEYGTYRNPDNNKCFIPSEHLRGCLINAGGYLKSKVGTKTKSMKSIVGAMFMVLPEEIYLPDYDEIDKRSVVNRNIKARLIKVRPKWSKWKAVFTLEIGEETLTKETIEELIRVGGSYVGIGSYRPTANGYFGRFKLISLKRIE